MSCKIDFVLPWVDPTDKAWQKQRILYEDKNIEDNASQTRFRDMNTLKYVLRSIEKNSPWYHKIYLITTGHYPVWLDIDHPKIELITHEELFIDKSALPVFNSNAIEMNLVNIKNLSEHFVYLSDDTIIWNPLDIERFFKNDKPVDFFHHGWIPRNRFFELLKGKDIWVDSLKNNLKLLNGITTSPKITDQQLFHPSYGILHKLSNFLYKNIYPEVFWINHWHHPQPYSKQTIQAVHKIFSSEMLKTSRHKFRSSQDITPYLYRYWHLIHGEFEPYYHNDGIVAQISSLNYLRGIIQKIDNHKNLNFICFNDQMKDNDPTEFQKISNILNIYLQNKFPNKASFEK